MDASAALMAVAAASLAVNGFFLRATAKDLRELQGRMTVVEKSDAIQEWRLDHLDGGG